MTYFTRVKNTLMSNPNGILYSVLSYGIQDKVKSNTRLYFYKYDVNDLIEIQLRDDIFCVFDFKHAENRAMELRNDLEYFVGYFKSAQLEDKRFLFDLSLRMPVNYNDFEERANIPADDKMFAFVLDKREGYICEDGEVNIFIPSERVYALDKCILSFLNNSIGVRMPRAFELDGCVSSVILSGLLSGVKLHEIEEQMEVISTDDKMKSTINKLTYSSSFIQKIKSKLKTDKFTRIIQKAAKSEVLNAEIVEAEPVNGEVFLRDIIEVGLDKFMKVLDSTKDVLKVKVDTEHQTIRSAYIVKGVMFITPVTFMPLSYFRELLDSDNIEYVLS